MAFKMKKTPLFQGTKNFGVGRKESPIRAVEPGLYDSEKSTEEQLIEASIAAADKKFGDEGVKVSMEQHLDARDVLAAQYRRKAHNSLNWNNEEEKKAALEWSRRVSYEFADDYIAVQATKKEVSGFTDNEWRNKSREFRIDHLQNGGVSPYHVKSDGTISDRSGGAGGNAGISSN